jgi:rhamnosyltransferase
MVDSQELNTSLNYVGCVSVIIRNRNEGNHLHHVLKALSVQIGPPLEVIVVDNASTDDSVKIAQDFGATVVHLPKDKFSYGRGLNVGLRVATGDVCVILSAHSIPVGKGFITSCLTPFSDAAISAARCVYATKSSDLIRWTCPETLDHSASLQDIISKGPLASGCVVRRSVWLKTPFDEDVDAAEDKLWAAAILKLGYKIVSPCDAFYVYTKPQSQAQLVRKNYRELRAIFGATGTRFGSARVPRVTTFYRAASKIAIRAPLAALSVIAREFTKVQLRMTFPMKRTEHELGPSPRLKSMVG